MFTAAYVESDVRAYRKSTVKRNLINRRLCTAWRCVCVCVCVCVDEQGDGPLWTCGKMRAPKRGNFSKVTDRSGKQTGEAVAVGTLKVYMGSRVTAPLILNFCTRYR